MENQEKTDSEHSFMDMKEEVERLNLVKKIGRLKNYLAELQVEVGNSLEMAT